MDIDISVYLKGLIDTNPHPVVISDLDHRVIYMNRTAIREYEKYGGSELVGKLLDPLCGMEAMSKVNMVVEWFRENAEHNKVFAYHNDDENTDVYLIAVRDSSGKLIGFSSVHERRTPDVGEPYCMD